MADHTPLVSICCATYNQVKYVRQCLDGFLKQETNFPFEVLVHDDASTDGTADIIREYASKYPDIFLPILQTENQYQKGNKKITASFNIPRARGKYIAICEGDDFWTDPKKLQKQVDFLEANPEYSLYCHNWSVLCEEKISDSPVQNLYKQPISFTFATLPWVWITKALTLMLRREAVNHEELLQYSFCRDVHIVYYALKSGKGYYNPEIMACYRMHEGGIWSQHDANEKNKTTYLLYKELYTHEKNKSLRKRYMNATLAYFNGLAYGKGTWFHIKTNGKLYLESLRNISDFKDVLFCIGGLVPTAVVKFLMKTFKI
ncbi:MAG: glycosyltransferase [Bacteroidales bacterium]|nr:glycosyltransferase [Bacteroidales bacterium]